jgi:YHS domain-containing protein
MKLSSALIVLVLASGVACATQVEKEPAVRAAASAAPTPPAQKRPALTEVTDTSQVCMVNNQFMARPQIPVIVGGKTYYGCCPMCQGKLQQDATARTATDPVNGHAVDKASAVIAKTDGGQVLYFESRDTLAAYQPN